MNKTWLILKHELIKTITRPSFIITLFLLPLAGFIITLVIAGISKSQAEQNGGTSNFLEDMVTTAESNLPEGYIDQAGLITRVPETSEETFLAFTTETEAGQAISDGIISAYYIIPEDYIESGEIFYIRPDFNPIGGSNQSYAFQDLLIYNLLDGNQQLTYRVADPINAQPEYLSPQPQRDSGNMLTFFLPYIVTMIFYIIILSSSSLMLSSMNTEKESKVLEILMTSIEPRQMLTGKIVALGIAGLLQTLVWSGTGYLLLIISGQSFDLPIAFQLPFSVVLWGLVFFALGYGLYASLMGGVGALVTNLREASQVTTVIILPVIIPLVFISALIEDPNGLLAVIMSIFPFTSPITMMTRLSATTVPLWQILLAVVLLVGTVWVVLRAVSGLFRAQTMLSGQTFSIKVFFQALSGKVG
ncbi:MAG TPA: ABC transporter permease [Longilinea sp.]|nr:ABC transporter permease [Longilinea sp.]